MRPAGRLGVAVKGIVAEHNGVLKAIFGGPVQRARKWLYRGHQ
jgi:hypothetical protein